MGAICRESLSQTAILTLPSRYVNRIPIRALSHADSLLPNKDRITATPTNPTSDTTLAVANAGNFRVGDQIQDATNTELMLVTAVNTSANTITVTRGYGGTTPQAIGLNDTVFILGNAALEGDDAANPRFTTRSRRGNWTQIFTETVLVSGSDMAVRQLAVADELDYQKQERLREMLRDLENTVINGIAPSTTPQGSAAVRRTLNGIIPQLTTNAFAPGVNGFPSGPGLTEPMLNQALRTIWAGSSRGRRRCRDGGGFGRRSARTRAGRRMACMWKCHTTAGRPLPATATRSACWARSAACGCRATGCRRNCFTRPREICSRFG